MDANRGLNKSELEIPIRKPPIDKKLVDLNLNTASVGVMKKTNPLSISQKMDNNLNQIFNNYAA